MFKQTRMRLRGPRCAIVGMTILLLLAIVPLAVASGGDGAVSYSGDDDYDPAAGGTPELSLLVFADAPRLMASCEITLSDE